ncbi:transporter [Clostridium sp. UBA6640]|uniref:transporter n=1 Tax=Clostridium sp. UBA6640 TaxID=1946370 RepID=UPI0025B88A3E|nr:transporter [Clostridium sp. UBA6640]
MNKNYIIEQCRRLEVIHQEESNMLKEEDELNNKWMLDHNDGHKELMSYFVSFLKNTDNRDIRGAKKWLKKAIKKSNDIIKNLDEKHNHFSNDEVMDQEDERIYHMNDGVICIAYILIDIINKKRYISKTNEIGRI